MAAVIAHDESEALRVAFEALLPLAPSALRALTLRSAIKALLNGEPTDTTSSREEAEKRRQTASAIPSPPAIASAPKPTKPRQADASALAEWHRLRKRVRAIMMQEHISGAALSKAIQMSATTYFRYMRPNARPHARLGEALAAWLAAHETGAKDKGGKPDKAQATSGNGDAHQDPSLRISDDTNRLSATEAERLAGYLARADERAVRSSLGMTPALAASAASLRDDLAPEVIDRVRAFLAAS